MGPNENAGHHEPPPLALLKAAPPVQYGRDHAPGARCAEHRTIRTVDPVRGRPSGASCQPKLNERRIEKEHPGETPGRCNDTETESLLQAIFFNYSERKCF